MFEDYSDAELDDYKRWVDDEVYARQRRAETLNALSQRIKAALTHNITREQIIALVNES